VVWDGVKGITVDDSGVRNYGRRATDPSTPTPADGDMYLNSALGMLMSFDASRGKWLSVETCELPFTRLGATGPGAFYRIGNRSMSAVHGRRAEADGTIVSITYTRDGDAEATFQVVASDNVVSALLSTVASARAFGINDDFDEGDVLTLRNAAGGATTNNVIGFCRIKWRSPA
jgi:hypothetical protein